MTVQKVYILDPAVVGLKIRELRKQKKLTLSELAAALKYATGKLSKIENGKRAKISIEEIEEIASVLGVPVESLFDTDPFKKSEEYERFLEQISQLEFKIQLGLFKTLDKKIEHLGEKLEESSFLDHLAIPYYFLCGRYYMNIRHFEKAYHHFNLVIGSEQNSELISEEFIEKTVQSYNYLSIIEYDNNRLKEALFYVTSALHRYQEDEESTQNLNLLLYNAGIIYARLGDYGVSRYYIKRCIDSESIDQQLLYECLVLESVNYYLDEQKEYAIKQLQKILQHFPKNIAVNIFELWELILFIDPGMIALSSSEVLEIIQTDVPADRLEVKLNCLHLWVKQAIKTSDYIHAYQIITECKKYDRMVINPLLKAYTYYLEAEAYRKMEQSDDKVILALKQAASFLDKESLEYWLIQYEIGQLQGEAWCNHPGSQMFYYNLKESGFQHQTIKLLPNLKS